MREVVVTGHEIRSVGRVVQNEPAVAGTSLVSHMGDSGSNILGSLEKHLACKRFAVDADAKQAVTT